MLKPGDRPLRRVFRWVCVLFALCLAVGFSGHTSWANLASSAASQKLYAQAKNEYLDLLYSKSKLKYRQNWERTIARFQSVLQKYPQSRESYKAAFTLGRLYQKLGKRSGRSQDIDQALAFYQRLSTQFPPGSLTDDALYYSGQLYLDRKRYDEARGAFQKILTDHPKGDFVPKARRQLAQEALQARASVSPSQKPVLLKDLTFTSNSGETRVTLKTDGAVQYTQRRLLNPDRVYFDFQNARWDDHLPDQIPVDDGRVQKLRMTQPQGASSRLVLDLNEEERQRVAVQKNNNRLVIVVPQNKRKFIPIKNNSSVAGEGSPAASPENQKIPVVVLDAGHGGKDFGARGVNGLFEKDLNLQISKQVKKILEDRYRLKVIMTRKDDTFIELRDRGKIANSHDADLFVSIHANAAERKSANGIETYYLGSGSTEQARETAERENGDLVHSVADDAVQEILASLISTTKINDSSRLAASVQTQLHKTLSKRFSGVHNLGVKEGPFFVLHDTNMPSILVEVGFVTNRKEVSHLKSRAYQKWLAEAIARGIYDYLKEKAPSI